MSNNNSLDITQVQIASHQETIKEKTDAVVKASKALNFMEALLSKNEKELYGLKARIAELECCMSSNTSNKECMMGTTTRKSIDCSVGSVDGVNLHESCRSEVAAENPMLKTLEGENECLKGEVQRLQDCVKDMVCQMDHLMMNDTTTSTQAGRDVSTRNESKVQECFDELKALNEGLKKELGQAKKDIEGTAKNLEVNMEEIFFEIHNNVP